MPEREQSRRDALAAENGTESAPNEALAWRELANTLEVPVPALHDDPNRRRDDRVHTAFQVSTTFVDAVRDPITHELCYHTSEEDAVLNVSRRGARLRCSRPPEVGTRVLLQIHRPDRQPSVEVIARACWTRVEYVSGRHGARAVAAVGVELLGGSRGALDRYESWLGELSGDRDTSVATTRALG